ncbi:hypothetical protein [Vibrio fluminensis]|uniref:hypothetical protein n=1 Tax=Vibrio fluminensis TaxID=2783614 RepID=UPI001887D3A1|nr:hypothetical protein [Vibrio fluminensis]
MKVAFLHTLAANQTLFDECIQGSKLAELADVVHYSAPDLLQYASNVGFDEHLAKLVAQQVQTLESLGANWVICTCSSIGRLAESCVTQHAKVLRIDRPMAQVASKAKQLTVLVALPTTIEPTMNLLAEYQANIENRASVRVIDGAWQHYLDGDLTAYQQTIADYIEQYCAQDETILLAQASMAPAVNLLVKPCQEKVLTSPRSCIEYLVEQLVLQAEKRES